MQEHFVHPLGALFSALSLALVLVLVPFMAAASPRSTAALNGVVTQIDGGDTLRITPPSGAAVAVRLRDIDAPLPCQPGGPQARRALADLALNKPAVLRPSGRDAQGRTVGVLLVDDVNVAQRLVEEGHAWSQRGRNDHGPLVKQERMAKALGRGVHGSPGSVMPTVWQRTHGGCAVGAGPENAAAKAGAAPAAPAAPAAAAYRCDGRTRCTQMHSCDEAKYFLAHCPGVKMDGDRNGVPCEEQWCGRP